MTLRLAGRTASSLLATLALALAGGPALGGERIRPTVQVTDLRLVITYVSTGELANLQHAYGAGLDRRELRQNYRRGFAILKTNRETGARTCEIYLPDGARPTTVDDAATLSLGHEVLHCLLGKYHR
jgi:hypothetical protein